MLLCLKFIYGLSTHLFSYPNKFRFFEISYKIFTISFCMFPLDFGPHIFKYFVMIIKLLQRFFYINPSFS